MSVQNQFGLAFFRSLGILAGALFVVVIGAICYEYFRSNFSPDVLIENGDFVLQSEKGAWHFQDHARDLNLLFFGYTRCPDVCPMTLARYREAWAGLGEAERRKSQMIFVSLDHERDDAQTVSEYVSHFAAQVVGLAGTKEQLDSLAKQYRFSYLFEQQPQSQIGYTVAHPNRVYLVNKSMQVIGAIPDADSPKEFVRVIRDELSSPWRTLAQLFSLDR